MKCINIKHPEFLRLVEDTKIPSYDLDYLVAKWQEKNSTDRFPTANELLPTIGNQDNFQYQFKVVNYALANLTQLNKWWNNKSIDKDTFWKKFQQLTQAPTEQVNLLRNSEGNNLEEKLTNFAANYSYTVEVNTAREQLPIDDQTRYYQEGDKYYSDDPYDGKQEITFEEYERYRPKLTSNSSYYSNLTVPGGTNYTEQEIAIPGIEVEEKPQGIPVKEAVKELFESNPELANAVYEALGFEIKSYNKPWRDGSNVNKAKSFALKNKPSEIFELVKDKEDNNYSIHFKTTGKESLTTGEKQRLIEVVAASIPIGAKLSTWGTVTKGGFAGLNRFLQEGFIKTSETRDSGGNLIPVYEKINKSNFEQQAQQLYSQYLESLNKPNTNPILQGNQTNIEEIITQLEKDGLLEIDCKGKLKAEKGLATSFTKGGKWKIYEIFEGKSHKQGGIDINIKNNQISFTNKNGSIKAKYGLVVPKDN